MNTIIHLLILPWARGILRRIRSYPALYRGAVLILAIATLLSPYPSLAQASGPTTSLPTSGVDVVASPYRLGHQLYQDTCATCHLAVPPATLPSTSWATLLQDPSHYGVQLTPPSGPRRTALWSYLQTYSRPQSPREERTPYRLAQSQYFQALHPQVTLPQPLTLQSCVQCHPGAVQNQYR